MRYLCNLKVKKVSFVRRGANRRQFFLAKSADYVDESGEKSINKQSGGAHKMRPEVKTKLSDILKKERDMERVCVLLKEDTALAVTEEELGEVKEVMSFIPVAPAESDAAALAKAQADARRAEDEKKALEARLTKVEQENHRKATSEWVEKECQYLNMTTEDAVNQIIKAESVSLETAEILKQSFKSTSDALRISKLTKEMGRGGDDALDPIGGNLVAEVVKKTQDLKKSDGGTKASDLISEAIKSVGPGRYETYRSEFNRRARTF